MIIIIIAITIMLCIIYSVSITYIYIQMNWCGEKAASWIEEEKNKKATEFARREEKEKCKRIA